MDIYVLLHSNCDNRIGSVWDKWDHPPVASELKGILSAYHTDEQVELAIIDLINFDECDIDCGDSTHYEIQKI